MARVVHCLVISCTILDMMSLFYECCFGVAAVRGGVIVIQYVN